MTQPTGDPVAFSKYNSPHVATEEALRSMETVTTTTTANQPVQPVTIVYESKPEQKTIVDYSKFKETPRIKMNKEPKMISLTSAIIMVVLFAVFSVFIWDYFQTKHTVSQIVTLEQQRELVAKVQQYEQNMKDVQTLFTNTNKLLNQVPWQPQDRETWRKLGYNMVEPEIEKKEEGKK